MGVSPVIDFSHLQSFLGMPCVSTTYWPSWNKLQVVWHMQLEHYVYAPDHVHVHVDVQLRRIQTSSGLAQGSQAPGNMYVSMCMYMQMCKSS